MSAFIHSIVQRNNHFFFFLVVMLFFLIGCSLIPSTMPTPTFQPPTATLSPTYTHIPPTRTPEPTSTATVAPLFTPTEAPTQPIDYDFTQLPGFLAITDYNCDKDVMAFCMDITLLNPDLKVVQKLTHQKDGLITDMLWSPDNRYIVFTALVTGPSGGFQLRMYDFKSKQTVALTKIIPDVSSLSWSPDNRHLAVGYADGSIQILDVVTHQMTSLIKDTKLTGLQVAWSPDGNYIAYSSSVHEGKINPGVYITSSKKDTQQLIESTGFLPSWSSDSKQLAFYCQQDASLTYLCVEEINSDGNWTGLIKTVGIKEADTFLTPVWSPSRQYIAEFAGSKDKLSAIVADLKNENIINMEKDKAEYRNPSWSPDSKALIFIRHDSSLYDTVFLNVFDSSGFFSVNTRVDFPNVHWSPSPKLP